jgi:RecB family exonuclease
MPADIINLRRARKAKARADRDKTSADNRVAFGRSKSGKALTKAERDLQQRMIDANRRETDKS